MRVVVVGAGILGASVAYHLAVAGAEVEVVDEAHEGKATNAGAGIVCPWSTKVEDADFYRLYAASGTFYPRLIEELAERGETNLGFRRVGALVVADDPADFEAAVERVAQRTAGVAEAGQVSRISPQDAKRLFPPLRDGYEAIHIEGAARLEVRFLAEALLRVAKARGAVVRSGHVSLALEKSRCRAAVDGVAIPADCVVVTAGAWAPHILVPLGVALLIAPQKGQIVHFKLPGTDTSRWPVMLPIASHYMLAFDDSRVVAGATREIGSGFDYRVTAAGEAEVINFALALAPGLASASVIETKIGFRPWTNGVKPLLGRVAGIEGLVIGNGLGPSGITLGPLSGKLLAQVALGETPELDVAPFSIPPAFKSAPDFV